MEENLSPCDFEYNMQLLASDIDDEQIRLQAIIDSMADDGTNEEGSNDLWHRTSANHAWYACAWW